MRSFLYLTNSVIFFVSSERIFDKDMSDSVLDLYILLWVELKNLMLSKKISGIRICIVCYFWIYI